MSVEDGGVEEWGGGSADRKSEKGKEAGNRVGYCQRGWDARRVSLDKGVREELVGVWDPKEEGRRWVLWNVIHTAGA